MAGLMTKKTGKYVEGSGRGLMLTFSPIIIMKSLRLKKLKPLTLSVLEVD
jgi:hypothetical protein